MVTKRSKRRLLPFTVLTVMLGLLLFPETAGAAGTLDQSQPLASGGVAGLNPDTPLIAQTFTAGITGNLVEVDLAFIIEAGGNCPPLEPRCGIVVQIQTVKSDGSPSGTVIGTGLFSNADLGNNPNPPVRISPITPTPVVAGTHYAIVLVWGGYGGTTYVFVGDTLFTYTRGNEWIQRTPGVWTGFANASMYFKTYVTRTPTVPTSKAQCKDGGWKNFGTMFKNQGQCIKYVNEHDK